MVGARSPAARQTPAAAIDTSDRVRRELARGTVDLAILAMLGGGRRYGYELLTVLNDLTGGAPEVKEGTLYPLLHRLEDAGQITATWQTQDRNPPRKYYVLTANGARQLGELRAAWERQVEGMRRLFAASGGKP